MRVVLIHGKDTDPSQKWYPWFGKEVEKMGYEFCAPVLPKAADPVIDEWLVEVDKTEPDEETILVGHSRGGVAILRWLEKLEPKKRIKKVILVAANSGRLKDKVISGKSNYGFYSAEGYDFEKIKTHCDNFVVLHSRDDKWVPFSAGETNAAGLSAKFLQFDDRGHFGKGVDEIPELLEETIGYDARRALIVPVNSKQQIFIQDGRGFKKPDWGYFGGEIEQGETPLEAVIRESEEKLDIRIKPEELKYMGISTTLWNDRKIIRYMHLYPTEQESFNVLDGKGGHWMSFEEARERLDDKDGFDEIVKHIEKIWP